MRFGPTPIASAEGTILAHSLAAAGQTFKKGQVLSQADVAVLEAAGYDTVVTARLEDGDVPESEAAAAVAAAVAGDGVRVAPAATGRCNLFATSSGLAVIEPDRIDRLNLRDEAITVASVSPFTPVVAGDMVATVKIIPFAAPSSSVAACCRVAGDGPPVRVAAFVSHRAGLVQTRLPGTKASVLEKTAATTRARLQALGSELVGAVVVDHDEAAVAAAIGRLHAAGADPILVLGASAIVDRRDVIPLALTAAGGTVLHFGMPVDPGNLLMLGRLGEASVLGLPGCARSPKLNGFDWVLWRLLAGLPVSRTDLMTMGAGGLLTEVPTARPLPGAGSVSGGGPGDAPAATAEAIVPAAAASGVAAIVLAAGRSTRLAGVNKLLAPVDGEPMVARAADAALASRADPVIVVVGYDAPHVRAALGDRPLSIVENPDHDQGVSSSIRVGIDALPATTTGAVFLLADMPKIEARHVDGLLQAFVHHGTQAICVPIRRGRRGNPVLWPAAFFQDLRALNGDTGARALFERHSASVHEVAMADDAVLVDCDTAESLAALS